MASDTLQYAIGKKRIYFEMLADNLSVRKPTFKDNLKRSITSSYDPNNLGRTKQRQVQLEQNLTPERIKHGANKSHKRMMKKSHEKVDHNSRPSDVSTIKSPYRK